MAKRGTGGYRGRRLAHSEGLPSPEFAIIKAVDWLRQRGLTVNQELWDGVYEIAQTAKRPSVRLRARQMFLDRVDPVPKATETVVVASAAGVVIHLGGLGDGAAGPQLQADGLTLDLGCGDGNGHGPGAGAADR